MRARTHGLSSRQAVEPEQCLDRLRARVAWEDGFSAVVKTTNPRPGLGGVARASRVAGYAVADNAARSFPWPLCHRSTRPDLERVAREAERVPAQRLRREAIACRSTPGGVTPRWLTEEIFMRHITLDHSSRVIAAPRRSCRSTPGGASRARGPRARAPRPDGGG